ncbi:MAG: 2-oxoacid:acceptor oxidoreductase family protein [Desulfobacterales bacterium]|jgi:indolepyruvate ferredoxin oxidoreductase beta subunit|nr:2-oxoacid:acceptor oxidoreductase family protein [Desulfobacterales bacterium]
MKDRVPYQIVISGVGGQGVLFITQLMAEAAIRKGFPVFTAETHGMAQRGGTVISHLKVGPFASPLIRPGEADGLIALKAESLDQHSGYLKPGAWAAVNSSASTKKTSGLCAHHLNADLLAQNIDNPRAINLIMLGFTLSLFLKADFNTAPLYCTMDDITHVLTDRLKGKDMLLQASIDALKAGASAH